MKTEKIKNITYIAHYLLLECESGKRYHVSAHGSLMEYCDNLRGRTGRPFTEQQLCEYVLCNGYPEDRAKFEETFPNLKKPFLKAVAARKEENRLSQIYQVNRKLEDIDGDMKTFKAMGMDKTMPEHWFSMIIQKEKLELEKKNLAKPNKS